MSTDKSKDWPRVSTVLKVLIPSYEGVSPGILAEAAERGERLHRLCLTYLASLDDLCKKPEEIRVEDRHAYLAFVEWCLMHKVEPIAIEQESVCTAHQYRGTPDALVSYGPKQVPKLIDLKFTASILRINRVQIQAYRMLDLYREATGCLLVHINPKDGKLKQETVKRELRDWSAFINALSVWRWRQG